MPTDPEIIEMYKPRANPWFSSAVEYRGEGSAHLLRSDVTISGTVAATYDVSSADVRMAVTHASLGMVRTLMELPNSRTGPDCDVLRVETPDGTLTLSGEIYCDVSMRFGNSSPTQAELRFHATEAHFAPRGACCACYWVLPLGNLITDFPFYDGHLDSHPLRVFPTPIVQDNLEGAQIQLAQHVTKTMSSLLTFEYEHTEVFIERLPDYRGICDDLKKRVCNAAITSLMVGEIRNEHSAGWSSMQEWLPIDVLPLLSLATGSMVTSPWIELRDEQGGLVRRIHLQRGMHGQVLGHEAVAGFTRAGGINRFLQRAVRSSFWRSADFRALTTLVTVAGRRDGAFLEDLASCVFRAFEILARHYRLDRKQLLNDIPEGIREDVREYVKTSADGIREICRPGIAKGAKWSASVQRIVSRMQSSIEMDNRFSDKVIGLLHHFNFGDAEAMQDFHTWRTSHVEHRLWADLVSLCRQVVVHEGYIDSEKLDIQDATDIMRHLHDILLRMVLKMLDYDGEYLPVAARVRKYRPLTWVTPTTPVAELGYWGAQVVDWHSGGAGGQNETDAST